jgi:SAM-dependent methyltransferase
VADAPAAGFAPRKCPCCGGAEARALFAVAARRFCGVNDTYREDFGAILGVAPDAEFPVVACARCGFAYAGLLPPAAFLERLYEEVIDPARALAASQAPAWVAHQLDLGSRLLGQLGRVFGGEGRLRVLDFGCGYGALVRALNGSRVACVGFETSRSRLEHLRRSGLPAVADVDEARRRGPYHAVVLGDVLEHVPAPREVLALCRGLLVPGGLLLACVPDFGGARLAAARAAAAAGAPCEREVNPWEHLGYFSPRTLRDLLAREGFSVVDEGRPVDVGLRPGLRGVRRWGNGAKSALRLLRHLAGRAPGSTCVFARVAGP